MGLLRYSELTTTGEYLLKNGEREYGAPVTFIGGEVRCKFPSHLHYMLGFDDDLLS